MLLELGFEVGDAGLERLDLVEKGKQDGADGGRSRLPVFGRNPEWRSELAHRLSMQHDGGVVKPSFGSHPSQ